MTETTKPPEKMSELIRLAITDGETASTGRSTPHAPTPGTSRGR